MLFRYLQLTFAVFQIDVDEANELESIGTVLVFVSRVEGYLACEGVSIDSALLFLYTPIEEYDLHCFSMATFLFMDRFLRRSQGFLPRIPRF